MRFVLWVVGEPGIGKTTLVRGLLGERTSIVSKPKWTEVVGRPVAAAGHYTGGPFDGADTVPYNGVADLLEYWKGHMQDRELTLLDGDRTSTQRVVSWFRAEGCRVLCALLAGIDPELAAGRRAARSSVVQNQAWVKGRATKSSRFFAEFNPEDRMAFRADLAPLRLVLAAQDWLSMAGVSPRVLRDDAVEHPGRSG